MLFEKTIRRKRISPFYIEVVGVVLYYQILIIITLLFFTYISWQYWGWHLLIIDVFCVILSILLIPVIKLNPLGYAQNLRFDIKNQYFSSNNYAIIDCNYLYATELWGDGYIETFLHLFYTEPYIRLCVFDVLPEGNVNIPTVPLKFYLPEVHFTYRWQKDYRKYRNEYEKIQEEFKKGRIREDLPKRVAINEKDLSEIYFYMTYEKMQAFNWLFELVNPHEFRIKTYASSGVFNSIEPIPGREYPLEALDCMEKINAMYP